MSTKVLMEIRDCPTASKEVLAIVDNVFNHYYTEEGRLDNEHRNDLIEELVAVGYPEWEAYGRMTINDPDVCDFGTVRRFREMIYKEMVSEAPRKWRNA